MIRVHSFEANIVTHCNYRCRACNHFAPVLPAGELTPAALLADLSALARVAHAGRIALLGGEPLLHTDLPAMLAAARASGLADEVWITTNGSRLARCADAVYQAVDGLIIDRYPGKLTDAAVETINRRARQHGVQVIWQTEARFYATATRAARTPDDARATWERCPYRRQCYTVHQGRLYRCPQSTFIPGLLMPDQPPDVDGLPLAGLTAAALDAFLARDEPLVSCARCAHNEAWASWREVPRDEWWETAYA